MNNQNNSAIHTIIQSAGPNFDINRPDTEGELSLHCAVNNGDVGITLTLLSYGAHVNSISSIPWRIQATKIHTKDDHPLVLAAELGDTPLVTLLLHKGANPNGLTSYRIHDRVSGTSKLIRSKGAIHWAVARKDVALVNILLHYGARPDLGGPRGDNAFHLVVSCISWWTYHDGQHTTWNMRNQQCMEQCKILQLLLNHCPNYKVVNLLNANGCSPLYQAVVYGCIRKVKMLLDAGADPNLCRCSSYGNGSRTSLHAAVDNGYHDIAQTLLHNGADLNLTNFCGHTPLLSNMLRCKRWDVMDATLIVHGANLEVMNSQRATLIGICIINMKGECEATCRLLFHAGCSLSGESWQRPFNRAHNRVEELCDWLRTRKHNPRTLKDLSRISIRKFLSEKVTNGRSIVGSLLNLPLPRRLQEHLLLTDIVDLDCHTSESGVFEPRVTPDTYPN